MTNKESKENPDRTTEQVAAQCDCGNAPTGPNGYCDECWERDGRPADPTCEAPDWEGSEACPSCAKVGYCQGAIKEES